MLSEEELKNLSLEKKSKLVTGAGFWDSAPCEDIALSSKKFADGPNGLRVQKKHANHLGLGSSLAATCFPTLSALGCSFDESLCEEVGKRLGEEAAHFGVSMLLAPGLNIKRSPCGGRNFEYFSEDNYLSGKLAAAYVKGVQSAGVCACVKHFAVNGREYARFYYDSRVDETTLRETYLTGFEIAVKEGAPGGVMTAYNRVNGVACNNNYSLITGILRGEWAYDGLVISDWGGTESRVKSLAAGADLEMPACRFSPTEVQNAVESGELDESALNAAVSRLYAFAEKTENLVDNADFAEHSVFAKRAAEECVTLLKNEGAALPLGCNESVAVIGDFAKKPRCQGGGSSRVNPVSLGNMLGAIKKSGLNYIGYEKGFKRGGGKSSFLSNKALKLANKADTLVVCLGLDEKQENEGMDRKTLSLPENQKLLLQKLFRLGKKVVVTLNCGGCVLTDWDCYCDALLLAHLGGQGGAEAAVNALSGKVNPSGRLAQSYPLNEGDEPCVSVFSSSAMKTDCAEGIYVGYKYYSALDVPVKYPFGYGLSYTKFEYSAFKITGKGVYFTVRNVGDTAGATVAQVYVNAPRALQASPPELKLFRKIFLGVGEERAVFLPFDEYSFRVWNENLHCFCAGGEYVVTLNENARDTLFAGKVLITEDEVPFGLKFALPDGEKLSYEEYYSSHITSPVEEPKGYKGMTATDGMPVRHLKYCKGFMAKLFAFAVAVGKKFGGETVSATLDWLSLRALMQFLKFDYNQKQGFLLALNGHFFKGLYKIIFKK